MGNQSSKQVERIGYRYSEENNALNFLPFLYAELLSQLEEPYLTAPQDLRMIRGEATKLTIEILSLSQGMESTDPIFEDICMPLDLLNHRLVHLSKEVDTRLEGPLCSAMECMMDIPTGDQGSTDSNPSYERLLATYHAAHYELHSFPNTLFIAIQLSPIDVEAVPLKSKLHLILRSCFKAQAEPLCSRLVPNALVSRFRRRSFTRFLELQIIFFIFCLLHGKNITTGNSVYS